MKKKISIILSVILLLGCMPLNAFAENVFNWIVEPSLVYDYVYGFEDGLSGVRAGGDELKRTWDDGTKFYNNNYHGVINLNGKEIIPVSPDNPTFAWGGNMEDGYAWKTDNGNTLVYNSDGELTLTLPYDDAYYWRDGFFIASTNENIMLMDMEGNIQLSVQKLYDNYSIYNWGKSFWEVVQRSSDYSKYRYDLYNYNGECVLENMDGISRTYASGSYDNKGKYYEAYYIKKNGKYALINDDAEQLTDFEYDTMEMLDSGQIKVTKNEKIGLIDRYGVVILPCEYDSVERNDFDNKECYKITNNGLLGLISVDGSIDIYPQYVNLSILNHILRCKKEDDSCDCINIDGDIVYSTYGYVAYDVKRLNENYYNTPDGITDIYGNYIFDYGNNHCMAYVLDKCNFFVNEYNINDYTNEYYIININDLSIRELTEYSRYKAIENTGLMIVEEGEFPNSKYGLIDINGNVIFSCKYDYMYNTTINNRTVFGIVKDDKYGLCDIKGNILLPCAYDRFYTADNNTFLRVIKDGKYGITDYNGNILVPCEFDSLNAKNVWGSYYKYYIEGKKGDVTYYGYIDKDNKLAVPCEYDAVSKYDNGYQVQKEGKYGIIGLDGNVILPCEYESASFMQDKYIKIKKNDKYGVLDLHGNPCIAPCYDEISNGGTDLFKVKQGDRYGILDTSGNDVLPIEYDNIFYEDSGGSSYTVYYKDCKWCIISKDTDGDGKEEYGLADENGKILLDCEYNNIKISDGIVIVQNEEGLWGWGKYEYKMPVTISSEVNEGIIEVSITNDDNLTGTMIAAYYKDNALVKIDKRDITDANGSINFEIPNANIDYYKIFVWDDVGSLQPLSHTAQGQLDVEYTEPEPADEPKDTDESKHETDFSNVTKLNIDGTIYEVIGRKEEILMDIDTISELTGYEYEWDNDTQITFTKEGASFSFILNTYDIIQHGKLEEDWKLDEKFQQINGKYYLQFLKGPVSLEAFTGDYTSGDDTMYITLTK